MGYAILAEECALHAGCLHRSVEKRSTFNASNKLSPQGVLSEREYKVSLLSVHDISRGLIAFRLFKLERYHRNTGVENDTSLLNYFYHENI
jgi:hypothetical protein